MGLTPPHPSADFVGSLPLPQGEREIQGQVGNHIHFWNPWGSGSAEAARIG
jgi:hypothetical protein